MYAQDWKGKWKLFDLYGVGTAGNLFLLKREDQAAFWNSQVVWHDFQGRSTPVIFIAEEKKRM